VTGTGSAASPSELGDAADAPPNGGLSTGPERAPLATGYPAAVRGQRIRAGQQPVRLSFLAVALLGLVAGCSSADAKSQPSAELPPASSSAAESTPELPPLGPEDFPVPDEARVKDQAGAEAFLRYWIDLLNHQRAIPEGKPLLELGPDCNGCIRIAQNYDNVAREGNSYRGGSLTLTDVPPPTLSGDKARISFAIRQEAVAIVDDSGEIVDPGLPPVPNAGSGIALAWSEPNVGWLVTAFDLG
jgi:hypothetical protein